MSIRSFVTSVLAGALMAAGTMSGAVAPAGATASYPLVPPAPVCGVTNLLLGPVLPPAGAIVVGPGDNSSVNWRTAGATYWLAPGVHTLAPTAFAQIIPGDNSTFTGGPAAILDGQSINHSAFGQTAKGVTIKFLTIQHFAALQNTAVINNAGSSNWTIQHNTLQDNSGAGVALGNNSVVSWNCIDSNGQYGFKAYKAQVPGKASITNVTLDHNEISNNNTDDWEHKVPGCGCSGGGKLWDTQGAKITNNWVHDNKNVGLWADTDDIDVLISGNYIEDNDSEGIFYEISYNAAIRNNTLKRNAIVKGQAFAATGNGFPVAAIYISESGGDSRLSHVRTGTSLLAVSGNYLEDNWGGVTLWESANRFCNSPTNASKGYCTRVGPASLAACSAPTIDAEPYYSDCRWKTQNVSVSNNKLHMDPAAVGDCNPRYCGRMALLSQWGTAPTWSPYKGKVIEDAVTYSQNNQFANNSYFGTWQFVAHDTAHMYSFAAWQAAPFDQDGGSTLS
ncbi:MAG: right-handed parallel beta-helix repeat-containing protein [Acidimicrobiales bacterium]